MKWANYEIESEHKIKADHYLPYRWSRAIYCNRTDHALQKQHRDLISGFPETGSDPRDQKKLN